MILGKKRLSLDNFKRILQDTLSKLLTDVCKTVSRKEETSKFEASNVAEQSEIDNK